MEKFAAKARKNFLNEAINKSDAQYTMKMVFDNHGFGKALKKMKILRRGITLNMSSYMGPSKTLDKIVKDFNGIMGTKYKADVDSFQKGHITSIELKEGLNEDYSQRARNFRVALRRRLQAMKPGKKVKIGKIFFKKLNNQEFTDNRGKAKFNSEEVVRAFKLAARDDIMQHRGARGDDMVDAYLKFEGKVNEGKKVTKQMWKKMDADARENALLTILNDPDDRRFDDYLEADWNKLPGWAQRDMRTEGKVNEYGAMNKMSDYKEKEQPIEEGVPFPQTEPNEFAYLDFKKWIKRNERHIRDDLKNYTDTKIFKRMEFWWSKWDKSANKGAFSNIKGNKFGRQLILMLRKDNLLFKNTGNKITNLKN